MKRKLIAFVATVAAAVAVPAVASAGNGGAGALQASIQAAVAAQVSAATSAVQQTPVNGNAPVTISAGGVTAGPSSANQNAEAKSHADSSNSAPTSQWGNQSQAVAGAGSCSAGCGGAVGGAGSCLGGCGGAGGAQLNAQKSETAQASAAKSDTKQTPVNGNAPVIISAGNVSSGPSSANQNVEAKSHADSWNSAPTNQASKQAQSVGGTGSCVVGCGGAGAAQLNAQKSETAQMSAASSATQQTPVDGNAPVTISAGGVSSGPSSANQNAAAHSAAGS